MIRQSILEYLDQHGATVRPLQHPREVSAQRLAQLLGVSGYSVAKTVMFEVGGEVWLGVLPAPERLDPERVRAAFGSPDVRLLDEREFAALFPGSEVGAEPPFGRLFGVPVVVDRCLSEQDLLVFRAGSHEECLLIRYADYWALETPAVAEIGTLPRPEEQRPAPRA